MICFPQIFGGTVQYPLQRSSRTRTLINILEDGSTIRMADSLNQVGWDLTYVDLSSAETTIIEQLFDSVQGRRGTFTFLDPADNLLRWSEDYQKPTWHPDPLIATSDSVSDPFGGEAAARLTNTGQANQRLMQSIDAPASYQYCLSVYLRSEQPASIRLVQSAAEAEFVKPYVTDTNWTRTSLTSNLVSSADTISFGIELSPGDQVEAYGMQVEAQLAAGTYKKTRDVAGVYAASRFDQDVLTIKTTAPDRHSLTLRVISNLRSE